MLFDASGTTKLSFNNGLYLSSGDTRIGIDNAGVPVVGNVKTRVNSRIITDATFVEVKAREEPNYSVPYPNYSQHLIGDFNMNIGSGEFTAPDQWEFNPQYGSALFIPATTTIRNGDQSGSLYSVVEHTLCIDVLSDSPWIPTSNNIVCTIGFRSASGNWSEFQIRENGNVYIARKDNSLVTPASETAMAQLPAQVNNWYRLTATFSNTGLKLYFGGVLVASTNTSAAKNAQLEFSRISSRATTRNLAIRNFRMWDSVLTDKQISTL